MITTRRQEWSYVSSWVTLVITVWLCSGMTGCRSSLPPVAETAELGQPDTAEESHGVKKVRRSDEASGASANSHPGLERDDTIFTTSARTRSFSGQGLIPRYLYIRKTDTYDGNDEVSDSQDREKRIRKIPFKVIYGVRPDLTVSVALPYVGKTLRKTEGGRRIKEESSGLGDGKIMSKWRVYTEAPPGEYLAFSVMGGVKLPSGEDDETDGGQKLSMPMQPGSGSVDGLIGGAFNRTWDGGRWLVNAAVLYKFNSEANDFQFGNRLNLDTGVQYRIHPYTYEEYEELTVNGVLEVNTEWKERNENNGTEVDGSGGMQTFLSPGLQVIFSENALIETGVQVPVYRDLNGGLGEDYRFLIGLRLLF